MTSTTITPEIFQNLGYNVEQMNDSEKVTLVRRRVVYEELVVSKDEFNEINEKIKTNDDDEFYLSNLKMEDIGFPDLPAEEVKYTAFQGDVTSFTDDAIAFMFTDIFWSDPYEPVNLATHQITLTAS